jgi:hypothetical protein
MERPAGTECGAGGDRRANGATEVTFFVARKPRRFGTASQVRCFRTPF